MLENKVDVDDLPHNTIYNGSYMINNKLQDKYNDYQLIKPFWCLYDYKQLLYDTIEDIDKIKQK